MPPPDRSSGGFGWLLRLLLLSLGLLQGSSTGEDILQLEAEVGSAFKTGAAPVTTVAPTGRPSAPPSPIPPSSAPTAAPSKPHCAPGQYSRQTYSEELDCQSCPLGKYQTRSGTAWFQLCSPCPTGRYQSQIGQTSCSSCSAGRHGNPGKMAPSAFTDCWLCPVGLYSAAGA